MSDLKVVVTGAGGRMGAAVIQTVSRTKGLVLHGALERHGAKTIGQDAGVLAALGPIGVQLSDDLDITLNNCDAIIDFSTPEASVEMAKQAAKRGLIHIVGTTGCTAIQEKAFEEAGEDGAKIVKAGNMSLGVNLLAALVKQAAAALNEDFDIEIVEMHHRQKVDSPSGTALMLGEAAAKGRNIELEANAVKSRDGIIGVRKEGTIGFATLRGGSVVGEHSVIFAGMGETIELTHKAQDRSLFANGAIRALMWVRDQGPGLYSMTDVLGFSD